MSALRIRSARVEDVGTILQLIRSLAEYERLAHEMIATEADLRRTLFGDRPAAEVLLAEWSGPDGSREAGRPDGPEPGGREEGSTARTTAVAGFALFFHNYSTFLGRPGIYLEDLFVRPELRGRGIGAALLRALARLAVERGCGRLEWSVLDWNEPALEFYRRLGAVPLDGWTVHRVTGPALRALAEGSPGDR